MSDPYDFASAHRPGERFYAEQDEYGLPTEHTVSALGGLLKGVSPMTANFISSAEATLKPRLTRRLVDAIDRNPQFFNFLPERLREPARIGARQVATEGVIFYGEAANCVRHVLDFRKDMASLGGRLGLPGHETSIKALFGNWGGNEVVDDAFRRSRQHFANNMIGEGLKSVSELPVVWAHYSGTSALNHDAEKAPTHGDVEKAADSEAVRMLLTTGAGFLGADFQNRYANKNSNVPGGGIAYDMIEHLAQEIADNPGSEIVEKRSRGAIKVSEYVQEIFQRHQKLRHEPEVGKHGSRELAVACDKIADALISGRIDPFRALVALVGDRKVVRHGGKHIASAAEIDHLIDDVARRFPPGPHESIADSYRDSIFDPEETKALLKNLKGEARDLFILAHPSEQMRAAGIGEEQQRAAATHDGARFNQRYQVLAAHALLRGDEMLRKDGMSEQDLAVLHEANDNGTLDDPHPRHQDMTGLRDVASNYKHGWQELASGRTTLAHMTREVRQAARDAYEGLADGNDCETADVPGHTLSDRRYDGAYGEQSRRL